MLLALCTRRSLLGSDGRRGAPHEAESVHWGSGVVQMSTDHEHLARQFYAAARALALHRGSLQERLGDAYADHLLELSARDLPDDLQAPFRELEQRMNSHTEDNDEDPIALAASQLNDSEAHALIERILLLYGRVVALSNEH